MILAFCELRSSKYPDRVANVVGIPLATTARPCGCGCGRTQFITAVLPISQHLNDNIDVWCIAKPAILPLPFKGERYRFLIIAVSDEEVVNLVTNGDVTSADLVYAQLALIDILFGGVFPQKELHDDPRGWSFEDYIKQVAPYALPILLTLF